jgi:hypothetical protein
MKYGNGFLDLLAAPDTHRKTLEDLFGPAVAD